MDDTTLESRFLRAMTDLAHKVLQAKDEQIYDLVMTQAQQFIREFLGSSHDGAAYALWMEVSDFYDHPAGPASEEACAQMGRKAATEWLAIGQTSTNEINKFFARWEPRSPGRSRKSGGRAAAARARKRPVSKDAGLRYAHCLMTTQLGTALA